MILVTTLIFILIEGFVFGNRLFWTNEITVSIDGDKLVEAPLGNENNNHIMECDKTKWQCM